MAKNYMGDAAEVRAAAAREWADEFAEHVRNGKPIKGKFQKALAVMVLDNNIRDFLAANDPQALIQAQRCFTPGKSYIAFLPAVNMS